MLVFSKIKKVMPMNNYHAIDENFHMLLIKKCHALKQYKNAMILIINMPWHKH